MDKIVINDLKVDTVIGTLPEERTKTQTLIINLELYLPLQKAGRSDDLFDSVDYSLIETKIVEMSKKTNFFLIERFAEEIADICLQEALISHLKVEVAKPGALKHSSKVAVCIERRKG
ncbi:MAG: dihydroneopterin aldolase [Victivallales bacterium]|nr:dihydroneopterin aldolase [Victivallales bacterium]